MLTKQRYETKLNQLIIRNKEWFYDNFPDVAFPKKINTSGRLKQSLGYCSVPKIRRSDKSVLENLMKIVISKNLLDYYPEDIQDDVFRHELIHYALYYQNLPSRDNDQYFIETCKELNVSLTHSYQYIGYAHIYECECDQEIISIKRLSKFIDNKSHQCQLCKSNVRYKERRILNYESV